AEEIKINEVNTGLLACRADKLKNWLQRLNNDNAQGEYYLTDVIAMAAEENYCVEAVIADTIAEVHGVNDRKQLAEAEAHLRKEKAEELMSSGVTLLDPARIDVRGKLECGKDVIIDVNVIFEGEVHLGDRVRIGANAIVKNAVIGADTEVLSHSLIDNAEIGKRCRVGPFARIRPDTALSDDVHIGNFVELKKSTVAENSKINHLSYVGDSKIGKGVNIGAGTITCNYDGVNKYQTVIGDDAFIGSNTSLVAPVKIGDGATVGAGSTIAKDVSDGKLAISRARQATVPNWKRPEKK
ncbi:MAG: bifunctional UDP-N-acetylglucosamine diphosphorylase/glucosamine-1-phosphate N-acetyltransferase GlmU, partial [Gammaproteobacteria bacterium]|nr:bifunctional UDP-N-acetylglucosamine diphosphorylase/glucosamine-1-phosphate N-acetyltransferase GlmU [Gammaproteobacteria bacterium]